MLFYVEKPILCRHCHISPPSLGSPHRWASVGNMTTTFKCVFVFFMFFFFLSAQGHQVVFPVTDMGVCDTERAP